MSKTIKISPNMVERAREFSEKVISTVNYRDSNQFNKNKIKHDHFISKIAEEAVKEVLVSGGFFVIGPDYKIYEGQRKSWDDDLFVYKDVYSNVGVGVAVKSQTRENALRYGLSWTFQASPKRTDPLLNKPKMLVFFVEVIIDDRECIVYPPKKVKDLIFKEPLLDYLKGKKKVVYGKDL